MSAFKCPKCGKLTGGNENFCIECGHSLNIKCPACGETWRFIFEYNFCPICGHHMKKEEETVNSSTKKTATSTKGTKNNEK
jgi:rRNA maturation endonuclease Nob1